MEYLDFELPIKELVTQNFMIRIFQKYQKLQFLQDQKILS